MILHAALIPLAIKAFEDGMRHGQAGGAIPELQDGEKRKAGGNRNDLYIPIQLSSRRYPARGR